MANDGALTDKQIADLAKRMGLDLAFIDFKSDLLTHKLEYNRGYVVNLSDEFDSKGKSQEGTHWCGLFVRKYPNGRVEPMWFDSFGAPCPTEVTEFVKRYTGISEVPHPTVDIQSLMSGICGFYVLAWLYYITKYEHRNKSLYYDTSQFLDMFDDLNKSVDFKKNEFILKNFFRSANPDERIPITVENKIAHDNPEHSHFPVDHRFV